MRQAPESDDSCTQPCAAGHRSCREPPLRCDLSNLRTDDIFQNFLDAKAGDMIIGYQSNPVKQIVAIGRVSAEQDGEKLFFEKVEGLTSPIDYATLRGCPELDRMEYFRNPQGSLFKLTRGEFDFILDMIRDENPVAQEASIDAYTKSDFLDEVYMTEKRYESLVTVLRNKKNIILHGSGDA